MYHWKSKRLRTVYFNVRQRCCNPNCKCYGNYGGRGIKFCDEWLNNPGEFEKWAFENGYDENADFGQCTIDRIDVNGNYEPNNCRWVTMKEQQNNRRNNHLVQYNGEEYTISELAEKIGVNKSTFTKRILYSKKPKMIFTQNNIHKRKVNMYLPKSHKLVNTFDSISEASAYVTGRSKGCSISNIADVCKGKRRTVYGFYWQYAD